MPNLPNYEEAVKSEIELMNVLRKYSQDVSDEKKQELAFMFDFADIINELQIKVVEARMKNVSEDQIKKNIDLVDRLLKIYKSFDSFYFTAHIVGQKIVHTEMVNLKMAKEIIELREENEKLVKSLEWK